MRINLHKFKKEARSKREEPKRQTSVDLYLSDFNDMLLLIDEEPTLSIGEIIREAVNYGLKYNPEIAPEIKRIKDKIEQQKLKEFERKQKIDFNLNRG